jgi:hypothetical protein
MNTSIRRWVGHGALILALVLLIASGGVAQERKAFATKGVVEVGGSVSFSSITPVSGGESGSAVTDGFELGVNPFGITSINYSNSTATVQQQRS